MAGEDKLQQLLKLFRFRIDQIPDPRQISPATRISFKDIVLSAFSVFYMQFPSFLSFQKSMEKERGENNCRTLFGIETIPTDNHIRKVLDNVFPEMFMPVLSDLLAFSRENGILKRFEYEDYGYLLAVDGTEYFRSAKVHCHKCMSRNVSGRLQYVHNALTCAIVHPRLPHVLPLVPEFIVRQDGQIKQDCERNSFKRWLDSQEKFLPDIPLTFLGDDLYANDPGCREILDRGHNFIFTCKPQSHKWLFECVVNSDCRELTESRWTGRQKIHTVYHFLNQVSIKDSPHALKVNWCEYIQTDESGKVLHRNSYITSHPITEKNVKSLVEAGRCRWKIENEAINTLKTKGYHFEHNFGHGKNHLSMTLLTLNLIAFFFHTLLEYIDPVYCELRRLLPARKTFFQDISALTRYFCFPGWNEMIAFMLQGLRQRHRPESIDFKPP